jgi:transcriptional regulator with XRE-family HTH domain
MSAIIKTKSPSPIDKHVGVRVRMRRKILGMSQTKLGKALHISFQQVQKYENGVNRIGAGKLQQIAQILDAPVAFFFEGAPVETNGAKMDNSDFVTPSQCLSLVKVFMHIKDDTMRRHIIDLVKRIAGE